KPANWEYKVIYYDAQKIESDAKNYVGGTDDFKNSVSSTSVIPDEKSLNDFGKDGWEIATSYLEDETVYPNLLASGDGVSGLQPNVRPQRLVVILKRPVRKK
ncbi:MAG: hypothetical protein ACKN9H_06330, partial [Methylophilaceae bacterium]